VGRTLDMKHGDGMKRIQRDGFTSILVDDEPLEDDKPRFLIDGLVARSLTLLYGQPKHGKSTLAMAIAIAVANGSPEFLGRKVNLDGPVKVGIIAGDPEDDIEYAKALRGNVPSGSVMTYCPQRPPQPEHWASVISEMKLWGVKLVIIDNLQAFCRDVNDSRLVAPMLDRCDQLTRAGIAVILVHHTSEKSTEHGPRTTPMGHTAISSAARWKVRAYLPDNGHLIVTCEGNYGGKHELRLSRPNGRPNFDVISTADTGELTDRYAKRKAARDKATLNRNGEIAAYVAAGHTQRDAADKFKVSQPTVARACAAVNGPKKPDLRVIRDS
jgi:hypothetical protein